VSAGRDPRELGRILSIGDVLAIAVGAGIPEPQARALLGTGLVIHETADVRITLKSVIEWAPFVDLSDQAVPGADT